MLLCVLGDATRAALRLIGDVAPRERFGHQLGVTGSRCVVEIPHGRVDVGVAHPLLQLQNRNGGVADDLGAERVSEVVKAQAAQPGRFET